MITALLRGKKIIVIHYALPSHAQNVEFIVEGLERDPRYLVIRSHEWNPGYLNQTKNYQNTVQDRKLTTIPSPGGIVLSNIFAHLSIVPACPKPPFYPLLAKRVHLFHSLASLEGVYKANDLDDFDLYFCAGVHHMEELPAWLKKNRKTKGLLIPGGYPKLDHLIEKARKLQNSRGVPLKSSRKRAIYAPTYLYSASEHAASLRVLGGQIVETVLHSHDLTFRPHPANCEGKEAEIVNAIIDSHKDDPGFTLDSSSDYTESYSESDLMITDMSGTAFTYAFAFEKPVIFIDRGASGTGIQFESRERIGLVCQNLKDLNDAIQDLMDRREEIIQSIIQFRNELIFNVGKSDQYFLDHVDQIMRGKIADGWKRLESA